MKFSSFTFLITDSCNLKCSYCYQKKGKKFINYSTIKKAVNFFLPNLKEKCHVNFSGGEPLLAIELIKRSVNYIQYKCKENKKHISYSITTNGILLNKEILQFLNSNKFSLLLSFDGIAQEMSREKGSFDSTVSVLEQIQKYPDINLKTNSVFTPETIKYCARSIRFILGLGVSDVILSLSTIDHWNPSSLIQLRKEIDFLKKNVQEIYKKTGKIPLTIFRKFSNQGVFYCSGGEDYMALTPDNKLWGCHLFADFLKEKNGLEEYHKYCFGDLNSFIKNPERIYNEKLLNYSKLYMTNFSTSERFCRECDLLKECWFCPLETAFAGTGIGKIPAYVCEIKKILMTEKKNFWKKFEK